MFRGKLSLKQSRRISLYHHNTYYGTHASGLIVNISKKHLLTSSPIKYPRYPKKKPRCDPRRSTSKRQSDRPVPAPAKKTYRSPLSIPKPLTQSLLMLDHDVQSKARVHAVCSMLTPHNFCGALRALDHGNPSDLPSLHLDIRQLL